MSRRVLVLCTGNSCRSQMAEALWRELAGGEWECHSAGSRPTGEVHPMALRVLAEDGIEHDGARSKSLEEFAGQRFDLVITVCDGAREACPVHPGASREHWPFADPADATGSTAERLAVFRGVRERIRARIERHLGLDRASDFASWVELQLDQWPDPWPDARRARFRDLVAWARDRIAAGTPVWPDLPGRLLEATREFGWAWNGIYSQRGNHLELTAAAGPPVCATLPRSGGIGSSGMCWDALLTGQPIMAGDVRGWPGYVSCDGESGLGTVAGVACPLRTRGGRPVAVWDMDATSPLSAAEAHAVVTLLGALCRWVGPPLPVAESGG